MTVPDHFTSLRRHLLSWWLSEFRALGLTSIASKLKGRSPPRVYLRPESGGLLVKAVASHKRRQFEELIAWADYTPTLLEARLAEFGMPLSSTTLILQGPPSWFFVRTFTIPGLARERLETLTVEELEHRTPFAANEVYFGTKIDPVQSNRTTLTVKQTIVRRDVAGEVLDRIGLAPEEVGLILPWGQEDLGAGVPLRRGVDSRSPSGNRLRKVLALLVVCLVIADAYLVWSRQAADISQLQSEMAAAGAKAQSVRDALDRYTKQQEALRSLIERRKLATMTMLWRETSHILPDDTWITDWRLQEDKVIMAGLSAGAASLVTIFNASPVFADATLNSPVSFDPATGKERFSLVVRAQGAPRASEQ